MWQTFKIKAEWIMNKNMWQCDKSSKLSPIIIKMGPIKLEWVSNSVTMH